MTTALAERTGLIGTPSLTGLALPADLTFDEWSGLLDRVDFLVAASPWFLVDVIAYGEARWGEAHAQAYPTPEEDPHGASQARMKQAAWMGRVYPSGTRVPGASYTHHRIVAELPAIERRRLLEDVAEKAGTEHPISTRELGRRAEARKRELQGTSVTIDGEVLDAADILAWAPSIDDLTDEARAALEQHAPQGRLRTAYVTGWLRALVYAEQRDLFREGAWRL